MDKKSLSNSDASERNSILCKNPNKQTLSSNKQILFKQILDTVYASPTQAYEFLKNSKDPKIMDYYDMILPNLDDKHPTSLLIFLDYANLVQEAQGEETVEQLFTTQRAKFRRHKLFWIKLLEMSVIVRKKDFDSSFKKIVDYLMVKDSNGILKELVSEKEEIKKNVIEGKKINIENKKANIENKKTSKIDILELSKKIQLKTALNSREASTPLSDFPEVEEVKRIQHYTNKECFKEPITQQEECFKEPITQQEECFKETITQQEECFKEPITQQQEYSIGEISNSEKFQSDFSKTFNSSNIFLEDENVNKDEPLLLENANKDEYFDQFRMTFPDTLESNKDLKDNNLKDNNHINNLNDNNHINNHIDNHINNYLDNHINFKIPENTQNLSIITLNQKQLTVLANLGSGGSSNVTKVLHESEIYALKNISGRDCRREIEFLEKFKKNGYTVQMIDYSIDSRGTMILLECGEIDLQKYIDMNQLNTHQIKAIWLRMVEIVNFLHNQKLIHRDIKPANFVFSKGIIKIIDFGISALISNETTSVLNAKDGTPLYSSPELYSEKKVGRYTDIWSLGVILYYMTYRKSIYKKTDRSSITQFHYRKEEIEFDKKDFLGEIVDELAIDIMKQCMKREPKERIETSSIMKHPYLSIKIRNG